MAPMGHLQYGAGRPVAAIDGSVCKIMKQGCSFRIAVSLVFIVSVRFLVFLMFLFVVVLLFGDSSNESVGDYRPINANTACWMYSAHAQWYAQMPREVVGPMLDSANADGHLTAL
jgi:hypothetical protein